MLPTVKVYFSGQPVLGLQLSACTAAGLLEGKPRGTLGLHENPLAGSRLGSASSSQQSICRLHACADSLQTGELFDLL